MLRLMEVVERLAWHQLNHIEVLDKETAAQWEIFPCVLKCIVDEVVIVCQHRKTATVAASKALAELSARKSSTATWTRGVQTAPQKSGRFEPKVIVPSSASATEPRDQTPSTAREDPLDSPPTVTRGVNTMRAPQTRQGAETQADLPCRRCIRRPTLTKKPCRSVGTSSMLATRSLGISAIAIVREAGTGTIPFPQFVDSSAQTDDGHAGTEMEIERYLERERSDGLASLDGESGPFTLHCSVNSALNRSHTGALREKEASPSPASPRVTEAAVRRAPENSTTLANNDAVLVDMVEANGGRSKLMEGVGKSQRNPSLDVKAPARPEEGGLVHRRVPSSTSAVAVDAGTKRAGGSSSSARRASGEDDQCPRPSDARVSSHADAQGGSAIEGDDNTTVIPVSSRARASFDREAPGQQQVVVALPLPPPQGHPQSKKAGSDISSWHESSLEDAEGADAEQHQQAVDKYANMLTTWVSGLWQDPPPSKRKRSQRRRISSSTLRVGSKEGEVEGARVMQITSAVSRYFSSSRERDQQPPEAGPSIQEPIVLPNSISAFQRRRGANNSTAILVPKRSSRKAFSCPMPSTIPSLFYSGAVPPAGPVDLREVRDWEQLSQYIPQVLSPLSPQLCTLMLRVLVIANKLAEHQLGYIDQMGCDTAAQWDVFPHVIKCIVDEIARLASRDHRKARQMSSACVQTIEVGLRTTVATGGQVRSASGPLCSPRDALEPRGSAFNPNPPGLTQGKRRPGVVSRPTQTRVWGDAAYDSALPAPYMFKRPPQKVKVSVQTESIMRANAAVSCTILDGLDAPSAPPDWFVDAMGADFEGADQGVSVAAGEGELPLRPSLLGGEGAYGSILSLTRRTGFDPQYGRAGSKFDALGENPPMVDEARSSLLIQPVSPSASATVEEQKSAEDDRDSLAESAGGEAGPLDRLRRDSSQDTSSSVDAAHGIVATTGDQSESYIDSAAAWFNTLWGAEEPAEAPPFIRRSTFSAATAVAYVPLPASPARRRRRR
ncbi:hypothetical protein FOZ63_028852 [Perkinsus olseni]|uniref:Uncharacterized protein n=2 Tax=Perkinsus olseni TaxID=32597 RepID=A0A7J6QKK3_PEROL|nr:hypothetical protein FOZ63_028852 [Perkinsus olseni]